MIELNRKKNYGSNNCVSQHFKNVSADNFYACAFCPKCKAFL